jgi:CPA2 family monovalent cation:H+ antiporter-2
MLVAPWQVLAVLAIILAGKPLAAFAIVFIFGYPVRTALLVAAALAQIGEFSFILADLGMELHLLPEEGFQIILASALISIVLNPFVFRTIGPIEAFLRSQPKLAAFLARRGGELAHLPPSGNGQALRGHVVLCGYGRVGSVIGQALERRGFTYAVVEQQRQQVEELRRRGVPAIYGDAASVLVLEHVHLAEARALVVAVPDPIAVQQIVEYARSVNPRLDIVVRTNSSDGRALLQEHGATEAVIGELELALEMTRHVLHRFGVDSREIQATIQSLRLRTELREET